MRMQKITKHLAAGLLLAGVTIPLASCVDDSYDMSKDIDMTMGIGSEGLKIKLGSTEKIMLADILETDGNLQTDSKNKYYLVEGGETSVNFTVSTVNAMLDNATLCPSYEVLKYDDIVPEELKGQPFEVEAGRVFDLDAPISAETEFDFDIDNIHEDVKWLKVIRPTAETSQLKFFLEIEQSAMDGIAFDNVEGLTIVFPEFIHLTNPKNGRLENNGKTFVLDNISNSGEPAIELGEATLDNITFKGETGKTDNGKLAIEDKISMNGKISFKTMNAITMTQGSAVNIKLTVSIGNRIDQQSQICIANVTGRFDPTIEPEVEKIDISSSLPDFLQDDEVTVNVSNPTMKFCADMTQTPLSLDFKATLNAIKGGEKLAEVSLPGLGEGKAGIESLKENTFYFYQKGQPYDPEGIAENAATYRVENISDLIKKLPDYIDVDLKGKQINVKDEDYTIELGRDYAANIKYNVYVPFDFNAGLRIIYNDSVDNMNEDLQDFEADGLAVTATVHNTIPLELMATLVPIGVDGKELTGVSVSKATVASAKAEAGKSMEENAVDSELKIEIKFNNPADLKKLDRLRFNINAEAINAEGGTLYSDQYLKVNDMRLRLTGQIIGNFN